MLSLLLVAACSGGTTCAADIAVQFKEKVLQTFDSTELAWAAFDAAGSGTISRSDMRRVLALVGLLLTKQERSDLRKALAGSRDSVSFRTFKAFLTDNGEEEIPRETVQRDWPTTVPKDPKTATGGPEEFSQLSPEVRDNLFYAIHGGWPPKKSWPGGAAMKATMAWDRYHYFKERRLMAIDDQQWRWERWLEQVQIRVLRNWTASGWGLSAMPAATHEKVLDFFTSNQPQLGEQNEGKVAGYIAGERSLLPLPSALKDEVTAETQKLVAQWAGYTAADQLEPTSTYGIRVYYNQSVLETHVDRVQTHILSAVYCVDRDDAGKEPWLMQTDPDLLGNNAKVDIGPGKLFFYESAKLSHGRPEKLNGNYYAHLFIHFRPKGWLFKNSDRVYGVPPWHLAQVGEAVPQLAIVEGEDTSADGGKQDLRLS